MLGIQLLNHVQPRSDSVGQSSHQLTALKPCYQLVCGLVEHLRYAAIMLCKDSDVC